MENKELRELIKEWYNESPKEGEIFLGKSGIEKLIEESKLDKENECNLVQLSILISKGAKLIGANKKTNDKYLHRALYEGKTFTARTFTPNYDLVKIAERYSK